MISFKASHAAARLCKFVTSIFLEKLEIIQFSDLTIYIYAYIVYVNTCRNYVFV